MNNKKLVQFSSSLCQLIHLYEDHQLLINMVFSIINKAQQISISLPNDLTGNNNIKPLLQFIQYSILIEQLSNEQLLAFIIFSFVHHFITFILLILDLLHKSNYTIKLLLHQYFRRYVQIYYLPTIYSSIIYWKFIKNCNSQIFMGTQLFILNILCIYNLIFALIMKAIQIYYFRADSIDKDDDIFQLNHSILRNIILELIQIASLIFQLTNINSLLQMFFIYVKWIIELFFYLKNLNTYKYSYITIFAFSISLELIFHLEAIYYIFTFPIIFITIFEIIQKKEADLITNNYQYNLNNIQIIEKKIRKLPQLEAKISLLTMFKKHRCVKCKSFDEMNHCNFRLIANQVSYNSCKVVYLFCQYISDKTPLRALVRLLLLNQDSLYYKSNSINLGIKLDEQIKLIEKQVNNEQYNKQFYNKLTKLDVKTAYISADIGHTLLPPITEAIQAKIEFWNQMIKGYSEISDCLQISLNTSQKIYHCYQIFQNVMDFQTFKIKILDKSDVLSLRITQAFFCGVYQNFQRGLEMEKYIQELLTIDAFFQNEFPNNTQLMKNQIFPFQSSLIKNRGEFINLNHKKLAKFLDTSENQVIQMVHCSQLMPNFIGSIHDKLMENMVMNGYSKLTHEGSKTFYQNLSGFIQPCGLNLYNFFNHNDDFLLNIIISKTLLDQEQLVFGIDGKIYGVTKDFYEFAFKKQLNEFSYNKFNSNKNNTNKEFSFSSFIDREPLIQYYINNICEIVNQLRLKIKAENSNIIHEAISQWCFPINHEECLLSTSYFLSPYKKQDCDQLTLKTIQVGKGGRKKYKRKTQSVYTQLKSQQSFKQYQSSQFDEEELQEIEIDNDPVIMLNRKFQDQITNIAEYQMDNQCIQITYSLTYECIKYKNEKVSYFVLKIKDYIDLKPQIQENYQQQSIINSFIENELQLDIIEEFQDEEEKNKQELAIDLNVKQDNLQLMSLESGINYNYPLSATSKKGFEASLNTNLQTFSLKQPLSSLQQKFADAMQFDSIEITDNEYQLQQRQQSLEQKQLNIHSKSNQKLMMTRQKNSINSKIYNNNKNQEMFNDFTSNRSSQSSLASNEAYNFLMQIWSNHKLITPLKYIVFIFLLFFSGWLTSIIVNVSIIQTSLYSQTNSVLNILAPQNINYYYTSILYQLFLNDLISQNTINISEFMIHNNYNTLANMMANGQDYMPSAQIDVSNLAQNYGYNYFVMKFLSLNISNYENVSFLDLYDIFYQKTYLMYEQNLDLITNSYEELRTNGTIRRNILDMMETHKNIIAMLVQDTTITQNNVSTEFMKIFFIELFILMTIILILIKYFLIINNIHLQIILLISRMTENQVLNQIQQLARIQSYTLNFTNALWRTCNFNEIVQNKKINFENLQNHKHNNKATRGDAALTNRIHNISYINKTPIIITFIIIVLLPSFLSFGYLIQMLENNNFQPSLTAALKYGQYRQNMDSASYLAGIIKAENLNLYFNSTYINITKAINLFSQYVSQIQPLLNEVSQVIMDNQIQTGTSYLYDLLNQDICQTSSWEVMKSCNPSLTNFTYYQSDNIQNIVSKGVIGYTSGFLHFIAENFNKEFTNFEYDTIENNQIETSSLQYQSFIIAYFCDIQNVLVDFLNAFQQFNTQLGDSILVIMKYYYFGAGIIILILLIIFSIFLIKYEQNKMKILKQILVLLPQDVIETTNIRRQSKMIMKQLY